MVPPKYQGKVNNEYCGRCHHATIAMYFLLDGKNNGYKVRKAIDELKIKHYWLESPTGAKIDPTEEQYTSLGHPLPYANQISQGVSHLQAKVIISNVQSKLQQGQQIVQHRLFLDGTGYASLLTQELI